MTLNPKEQISRVATSDDNLKNNISDKNSLNVIQKSSKFPANVPGPEYKMELKWTNIIIISILHVLFIVNFFVDKKWQTLVFGIFQGFLSGIGITVAAHRLFSHNSFKANTALKLLLLYFQTLSFQNSAYDWARDHRLHHKYTDTNADPHNIRRGFFFSHVGWLLCKKHPDIKKFAKKISMADLEADKLVMFQHRHFTIIKLVVAALIPALIPCYFWNESFLASFLFANIFRYIVTLHMTWMINSAAHTYGMRPFDKSISPTDSYYVGIVTIGEGWHNYHHVFPYGYNSSDFGSHFFNITAGFIDFFAWIGWAYDLKTVSLDMIRKRAIRAGDGSYNPLENPELLEKSDNEILKELILKRSIDDNGNVILNNKEQIWGEEDEAMSEEERKYIKILRKLED